VTLTLADLAGDYNNVKNTTVVVIRTGFSTHAMNMGQRFVQLDNSYTVTDKGDITLHVSQLPPNPAIIAPGPAMLFVVCKGVPSIGQFVMLGTGQLGIPPTSTPQVLPVSSIPVNLPSSSGGSSGSGGSNHHNAASSVRSSFGVAAMVMSAAAAVFITLA